MSYIGRVEQKASDIRRFNVTGSTSATHTLTWTPPNEQSLIITINGVKQQEDSYSVSGAVVTLTSALVSTDKMEVVGILDIGETTIPGDNSVTTAKIQDNAVTSAKIEDGAIVNADVNASAAIALSKLASDPSNASNLASGTVPTARLGSGTASSSTFLRGDQSWAAAGGGKVLQFVIDSYGSQQGTTSDSYVDVPNLSTTITLSNSSNTVLVWGSINGVYQSGGAADQAIAFQLMRDSSKIVGLSNYNCFNGTAENLGTATFGFTYQDSPGDTSAHTYKLQWKRRFDDGSSTVSMNVNDGDGCYSSIICLEIEA